MASRTAHLFIAAAGLCGALATIALLAWPAWLDHTPQRPGSGKTDQLLTLRTLPAAPDIPPAVPGVSVPMMIAADVNGLPAPGDWRTGRNDDDPPLYPAPPDISGGNSGAAAAPATNADQKKGVIVYRDYSGRIGSNGKLSLRRAGDGATQQFEIDLVRKRTGVKVKVPF